MSALAKYWKPIVGGAVVLGGVCYFMSGGNVKRTVNIQELEQMYSKLQDPTCKSRLKKHLTKDVFDKIKERTTSMGGSLKECIVSGVDNLDSGCGLYACDPKAYDTYVELFDPLIADYHSIKGKVEHPKPDFGDPKKLPYGGALDKDGKYIVSTRIRVGRSHAEHSFPPMLDAAEKLVMEAKVKKAFNTFSGVHKGTYYPLVGMDKKTEKQLVDDHFLFKDDDRFLRSAGGYNHWPLGRGIFHNDDKTFLVWVNEEDHLRIISMQQGGDIGGVYSRLVKGVQQMESSGLNFAKHPKYGYLTFCPTNLGTTLRASVHVRIPWLSAQSNFKEVCEAYKLQPRGIHGEHTESAGGIYDISNKHRMGLTEFQAVSDMVEGVNAIIEMEKSKSVMFPK